MTLLKIIFHLISMIKKMLYKLIFREKVKFEVISFKPRQAGVNSINIKKIIKIGWKALGDFKQLKMDIESKNE